MRIAVIYGTRPEAIKLAPVVVSLNQKESYEVDLICTGQHKELLNGILEIWGLTNNVELDTNFNESPLVSLTEITNKLQVVFAAKKYDLVIVQGDTSSALAGALTGHFNNIPVAHIEAGLRSGDPQNPWPEEGNRRAIDSLAKIHFAPTQISANNLKNEGYSKSVFVTGNTVVDALEFVKKKIASNPKIEIEVQKKMPFSLDCNYILFTQHRRESFDGGIDKVFSAIRKLADHGEVIIFPVHLNPSVSDKANSQLADHDNIYLLPPLEYLEFLLVIQRCKIIISDSGGLQEEAPSFGKRILITRKTTERPEIINSGFGELVGFDGALIVDKVLSFVKSEKGSQNPFGNGNASIEILKQIENFFAVSNKEGVL